MKVTITLTKTQSALLNGAVFTGVYGGTREEVALALLQDKLSQLVINGFFEKALSHNAAIDKLGKLP